MLNSLLWMLKNICMKNKKNLISYSEYDVEPPLIKVFSKTTECTTWKNLFHFIVSTSLVKIIFNKTTIPTPKNRTNKFNMMINNTQNGNHEFYFVSVGIGMKEMLLSRWKNINSKGMIFCLKLIWKTVNIRFWFWSKWIFITKIKPLVHFRMLLIMFVVTAKIIEGKY